MGAWEIVLIIACAMLVVGVAISFIVKKIKGKPTCDCGCCKNCTSNCCSVKGKKEEKSD